MRAFCYAITSVMCVLSGIGLLVALAQDNAIRQAAVAATAVGFAVVPYIFSRCVERAHSQTARTNELLEKILALQTDPAPASGAGTVAR